jgi:hypothetical protein
MSQKQVKRIRRQVRKESDKIKVMALDEFKAYAKTQGLKRRVALAIKIILKRL